MAWSKTQRITTMLAIDVAFFLLELIVGLIVGSLALMADAFHMLNDIISLLVGLWAVKAAQKSSSDKYSFGWLRAEILGAFFNAVFLIALCLSIVLEAVTRLIEPPEISNPKLILIVGSLGLLSNLAGFFVLGGHGHSHGGGDDHDHEHAHAHSAVDKLRAAEEGTYDEGIPDAADESGRVADILPEGVLARATSRKFPDSPRHIRFTTSDETASTSRASDASPLSKFNSRQTSRRNHRRRASSVRSGRLANIEDLSIHPASFRQEIIAASRPQVDGGASEEPSDDSAIEDDATKAPTEISPLLAKSSNGHEHQNGKPYDHDHDHDHDDDDHDDEERGRVARHDSLHAQHNHNKPRKESGGHGGHNHGDMGMRAMILHVIGDALGNVGVIVSALIIWLTPWSGRFYADPAVSLFITIIILHSTIPLTSATAKILLQATPDHLDVDDIKEDIQDIPGVVSCHHVHIWQLSDSQIVASMHIQVSFPLSSEGGEERYMELAKAVRKCLHAYGIHSATVQPEFCVDKAHDHPPTTGAGFDGPTNGTTRGESCLLGCVEDCEGNGCCGGSQSTEHESSENSHDHGHDLNDHDHGHSH